MPAMLSCLQRQKPAILDGRAALDSAIPGRARRVDVGTRREGMAWVLVWDGWVHGAARDSC